MDHRPCHICNSRRLKIQHYIGHLNVSLEPYPNYVIKMLIFIIQLNLLFDKRK